MEWSAWTEQSKESKAEYITFSTNHKDIEFCIISDDDLNSSCVRVCVYFFLLLSTSFLFLYVSA